MTDQDRPPFEQLTLDGPPAPVAAPAPAAAEPGRRLTLEAIAATIERPAGRSITGPYVGEFDGAYRVHYAGAEPIIVGPPFSLDRAGARMAAGLSKLLEQRDRSRR